MKKNYNELDLKYLYKYILSCKKIIIIIIFTFISLTLAFKLSTPKSYKATAIIKKLNEFTINRSDFKFIENSEDTSLIAFYEYYLEVVSQKNLDEYLKTISINNKNFQISFDIDNIAEINNTSLNIRLITLRSKNFKENLDDLLNKYLIYTEEKIKKKYKAQFLNNYTNYLAMLINLNNLEIEDSKKFKNNSKINVYQILVNEITVVEKKIDLIKSDNFFLGSFIFKEAKEVSLNESSLLFILLMSLIVSLFISIFVISIKYTLTK